jgi:hypothetical protein
VNLLRAVFSLPGIKPGKGRDLNEALSYLKEGMPEGLPDDLCWWRIPVLWSLVSSTGALRSGGGRAGEGRALMDELLLGKAMKECLINLGLNEGEAGRDVLLVRVLAAHQDWSRGADDPGQALLSVLEDYDVRSWVGVNDFGGRTWFNRESFEKLMYWLFACSVVRSVGSHTVSASARMISRDFREVHDLLKRSEESGYDLEEFISLLKGTGEEAAPLSSAGIRERPAGLRRRTRRAVIMK